MHRLIQCWEAELVHPDAFMTHLHLAFCSRRLISLHKSMPPVDIRISGELAQWESCAWELSQGWKAVWGCLFSGSLPWTIAEAAWALGWKTLLTPDAFPPLSFPRSLSAGPGLVMTPSSLLSPLAPTPEEAPVRATYPHNPSLPSVFHQNFNEHNKNINTFMY